jgi:glutamate/tyrosine decarboxylase-like PLP-dependent enzyme
MTVSHNLCYGVGDLSNDWKLSTWNDLPWEKLMQLLSQTAIHPELGASKAPLELREILDLSLQSEGRGWDQLMDDLALYIRHSRNPLHPHFANQLYAAPLPSAFAGDVVSTLLNSTMATYEASPVATLIERALVHRLGKMIGWERTEGLMVTGGSNANFAGLLLARNTRFPETKKLGNGHTRFCVFVSEEAHYSFYKALNQLGIGTDHLIAVPSDKQGRMKVHDLERLILNAKERGFTPLACVFTAGTTVLGAFDPLDEGLDVCRKYDLWAHVDAAWGGGALMSKKHKSLLLGIQKADSVTWDTHKMLGTGLVSSFILTRHLGSLLNSHRGGGNNYLFHDGQENTIDLGPMSLQCGRRVDALKVWLSWRHLGDRGFEELAEKLLERAQWMAKEIQRRERFQLLYQPTFLNICFRYLPKRTYLANIAVRPIREDLMKRGEAMINWSSRSGESFLRFIVVHPQADEKVLTLLLDHIEEAGQRWEATYKGSGDDF